MVHWLEHASWGRIVVLGLLGAGLFELVTAILRFRLRLRSSQQTAWIGRLTFGLRIHHGYAGILLLLLATLPLSPFPLRLGIIVGLGLALSDALHHFVVLPLSVGATEFDTHYAR